MSSRTSPPTSSSALSRRQLEAWLLAIERRIALLERCRPENLLEERARLERAWRQGERVEPAFLYAPAPRFGELRRALDEMVRVLGDGDPLDQLYAARAHELSLEAWVAEAVGQAELRQRAQARFVLPTDHHARRAEAWAREWTREPSPSVTAPTVASDDEWHPLSLLNALRRELSRRRVGFRVVVRADLMSTAATADGVIAVRAGVALREQQVERIVIHEVEGHAWPRWRAQRRSLGLLRVGTAGAGEEEEGRALLLERRSGHADQTRRAELGWRHLAALAVRQGADFVEVVELLRELGAPLPTALELAIRCRRGAGLAREVVYLVALSRVESTLAEEPELEAWLEQGRVSLAAARVLAQAWGSAQSGANPCSAPGADTRWESSP